MKENSTKLLFAGGVAEIGSNKIYIESSQGNAIFLDFGMDFDISTRYLDTYMPIKKHLEIYSMIVLGGLPKPVGKMAGIYRKDLLKQSVEIMQKDFGYKSEDITDVTDLLLSHPHADHYSAINYLVPEINIHAYNGAERIIDFMESTGGQSVLSSIREFKEEFVEEPKTDRKGNEILDDNGEIQMKRPTKRQKIIRNFIYHPSRETFYDKNKNFEITIYPVDHSILGAAGYLIKDLNSGIKIMYSGDYRCHGRRSEMTRKFVEDAKAFQPDIMISEGTRVHESVNTEEMGGEIELEHEFTKLFKEHKESGNNSLIVVDTNIKNVDRIQSVYNATVAAGKKLVLDPKNYVFLKAYEDDSEFTFNFENIYPYLPAKGFGIYSKSDYKSDKAAQTILDSYSDMILNAEDIQAKQSEYVIIMTYYKFVELIEMKPNPNSIYVRSSADPFNADMEIDMAKAINWLNLFKFKQVNGIPIYKIHCSGHMKEEDLVKVINHVKPKILFPIHSEHPERFYDLSIDPEIQITLPELNKLYEFRD